ncbi:MAG: T9SS type A sorting domain-containing protein [Bacteroidetes bacterium]|nr:T9SS type A sorting domain-containing protein [Bacteroidota bacterium]
MKFKLFFILFFCEIYVFSQNNLIHNSSFEFAESGQPLLTPCKIGLADLLDVWETDDFFGGVCTYKKCDGPQNCECKANCKFHSPDWFVNNSLYCNAAERADSNQSPQIVQPKTGEKFIGFRTKEIIQQKFFNSSPIQGGKTYVFSAYVRIPKPPQLNKIPIGLYNFYFTRGWPAGCNFGTPISQGSIVNFFDSNDNIALDIFLSTSKIKYADGLILTCNSTEASDLKNGSNNIAKLNTFNLNIATHAPLMWHRINFEFVCPSNHNYDWFAMELNNSLSFGSSAYLLVDDVSIVEKCELESTNTSGIPNPLIASAVSNNCSQGQVSNIQNVSNLKIEVFTLHGQLIRVQQFFSINGFASPRYWDGNTQALSPAAPATYILKATCTNACGTFTFAEQIFHTCSFASNPPDVLAEEEFKPCCEINHYFNNKTFGTVSGLPHQYFYHPKSGIYVNDCSFTTGGVTTLKAGKEIVFTGETQITTHLSVNFQAIIEECSDAHRLAQTTLTDKDFVFYESNGVEDSSNDIPKLNSNKYLINTFKILPNPNNGNFKVILNSNSELPNLLTVLDYQGKELMRIDNPSEYEFNFSLNNLTKGLYLIKAHYKNNVVSQKLIIQ